MTEAVVPNVEFDHWGPDYAKDPVGHYQNLSGKCPVARSDFHGGFWFVTGYEEVRQVAQDDATFSCHHDLPNGSSHFLGTQHPPTPFRVTPMEMDPPDYVEWRQSLLPHFSPASVARFHERMHEYIRWFLDRRIESGECELIKDLLSPVPSLINMELLGIPIERGVEFAHHSHAIVYTDPSTPQFTKVYEDYGNAVASLAELVEERRASPRDDLISFLTQMRVQGEQIPDDQIMEVLNLVVSAGIDTTASATACVIKYLDENRDARRELIADPGLIPKAIEECLRYYSPVQVLARTATRDVELGGQAIRRGDRVLVSWAGANLDHRAYEEPEKIAFGRFPNRHMAFGLGIHRCLGSNFARTEMTAMITAILERIPDYELSPDVKKYGSIGIIQGYIALPATFTPGPRIGGRSRLDDLDLF